MFNPIFWVVIAGFVHILPSTGLYLTQHFLECKSDFEMAVL